MSEREINVVKIADSCIDIVVIGNSDQDSQ